MCSIPLDGRFENGPGLRVCGERKFILSARSEKSIGWSVFRLYPEKEEEEVTAAAEEVYCIFASRATNPALVRAPSEQQKQDDDGSRNNNVRPRRYIYTSRELNGSNFKIKTTEQTSLPPPCRSDLHDNFAHPGPPVRIVTSCRWSY